MREIVAEDDVSAGKGALLTASVVSHLSWIGNTVGPVLDEVRKTLHLAKLRKVSANIEKFTAFRLQKEVAWYPTISAGYSLDEHVGWRAYLLV